MDRHLVHLRLVPGPVEIAVAGNLPAFPGYPKHGVAAVHLAEQLPLGPRRIKAETFNL